MGGSQGELFGPGATPKRRTPKGKKKNASAPGPSPPKQEPGKTGAENEGAPNQGQAGKPATEYDGHSQQNPAGEADRVGSQPSQCHQQQASDRQQGSMMGASAKKGKNNSPRPSKAKRRTSSKKKVSPSRASAGPSSGFLPGKRWGLLFYGASALVLLILLFLWLRVPDSSYQPSTAFMNGKIPNQGTITYEEPLPSGQAKPLPDIQLVDEALFKALLETGVPPQATHLALAHGPAGEISLLKAQLPPDVSPDQAAARLETNLARTKATGVWRANGHGREFTISLAGRVTHKVLLEYPKAPKPSAPSPPAAPKPAPPAVSPRGPRLAIIIDDIGYQWGLAKELINLGIPLTLSILPHSPFGAKISKLARKRGLEIMIHLPMEPRAYPKLKPGPGALLTSMTPAQLEKATLDNLASVPEATGANNHMGSRFTEDEQALRPVLKVLAAKGLFFIDSMTSPNSRAYYLARNMGMNAGRRTIFLDHDHSLPAVRRQMQRLMSLAKRGSQVVAIGHPHPATIQALAEFAPRLKNEVQVVKASQFLAGTTIAGKGNR